MNKNTRPPWLFFSIIATFLIIPRFFMLPSLFSRGLEFASLYREVGAPFRAGVFWQRERICGDLPSLLGQKDFCTPRSEIFQTDSWGYRNSPEVAARHNDVLIFGDSYAFGQGMSQEDIPSEQISRIAHVKAFNGGGKMEINYLRWLLEHFREPVKTVVYFHLERHHLKPTECLEWQKHITHSPFLFFGPFWETFSRYNPLKIFLEKKYFPEPSFPLDPPPYLLRNGTPFLFLASSIEQYGDPRLAEVPLEAGFFAGLKEILAEQNLRLVVLLIPEKFTVYAPLLASPPKPAVLGPLYLDNLAKALTEQGVINVNLLPVFKTQAALGADQKEYLYWPDDTHWNPRGVKLMAEELKKIL